MKQMGRASLAWVSALLLVAGLGLGGCGDDDHGSTLDTGTATDAGTDTGTGSDGGPDSGPPPNGACVPDPAQPNCDSCATFESDPRNLCGPHVANCTPFDQNRIPGWPDNVPNPAVD